MPRGVASVRKHPIVSDVCGVAREVAFSRVILSWNRAVARSYNGSPLLNG